MTCLAIALANRFSLVYVLRSQLAWGALTAYLTTAPLVLLMALSYLHIGYLGTTLFLLPLFLTRIVFKLYRDTRQNYVETVQALAQAIDAKDAYTRGHAERVAVYAVEIARRLKWRGDRLEQLYFVGLLHDIGKMGVRDAILTKNGPLTPEEREEINNHPQIGAEIVAKISFLKEEAAYIRHHHEHYNGRGYPGKIEREVIPLGARIIAVADAFDAMTTIRSYQPARSVAEALFELRHCSHSQFDPLVVEAMAGFIRENPDVIVFAQEAAATGYSYLARTTGQ
ncbi:MAG: 3'3'-cGAMP-specific phosphodiesterase 3 [Firmicutes bacterium]|nr:3'3'-cGAMP-specific phosphodiesterase 3 [Bacillota bacterium]